MNADGGPQSAGGRRPAAERACAAFRGFALATAFLLIYGCTTTARQPQPPQVLHGVASWYGEEFAGRTTANGEIFDPMQLTAAHRTLPFGTVVDVKNTKTNQTVRVRINDRGPFVGNRMIDLSYAAAQRIGLIDPGSGEVDVSIVSLGKGDREPPTPYTVTIGEPEEKAPIDSSGPPKVDFPLPAQVAKSAPATTTPAATTTDADFRLEVVEEHGGVVTRKEAAPGGKTFISVPTNSPSAVTEKPPAARSSGAYIVQVGAFSIEANARALQEQLTRIGQKSYVEHDSLYRVRLGPFATRDDAVKARTALEAKGISAIVVTE